MLLRRVTAHIRAQNWFAVGLDFLIVVIGILLAFQITEWSEERRERVREQSYLERIASELDQSIKTIENSIELSREREALGKFLLACVEDDGLVRAEPGRFTFALLAAGYTFSPTIRSHTFDEIKSAGDLGLFSDKDLLLEITEFYTSIARTEQWFYLRELRQTEYMKRAAGILTYALLKQTPYAEGIPEIAAEDALAARARMLERPDFIEWLPWVVDRYDDIRNYELQLELASRLRERIKASLEGTKDGKMQVPVT